ncbi:N-acetyl-D-glucosamine kinase [Vibrio nigripulchritudo MADA3029]|uniref:N-acetyl-D-glucosamine kinase n=1 Tax=Vibrio nigripulchritudo TaxID=28173 RepID=U4KFF5_9VIBR|nr:MULTISPECIES: N-acetylglucosamine kinase [Vibrio]EGU60693.1 N-acetyl-D-glucosamine kinase [Vibrio nigripulchritudo ATCC 27043]KJY76892.1 N-acetylglucosamine kinase [Vibrio nigripulchritudo]UAB68731.1 N-acetylglucosamine kinase [Vibrio sp. SCSIO 43132]CCN35271.1 N-acetyl-D-glucosamine kinase [Vibrio nigripulchritudo AM115]CCN43262.1 N-acetyl-D-glucosamine kinase [Vibrio nigripulchritudo FTn2]
MYYGFDVGGTKIEFGAFNDKLERQATERVPTPGDDYEKLVETIAGLVAKYDAEFGTQGTIGIGIPGMENADDGTVLTVNVPAAKGRPLRSDLEAKIGRSVKIENDANCFVLSEAMDEDLKDEPVVMGLILGTGFGGGFVFEGKTHSGLNSVAGEIGHTRLPIDAWFHLGDNAPLFDCGSGKKGSLDSYLSGRGFELLYEHYYGERIKAVELIKLHAEGEEKAVEHVERFMELLAICLGNLFTSFDPNVVVLGGGLSNFDLIYEEMPKRVPKYLLSIAKAPKIVKAKYGDSGGVRGAAFLNIK